MHKAVLGRRGLERLDLLLLAVETLDLNGGEAMLWTSSQIGLKDQFSSRVELWKLRCHNPLRKSTRRGRLSTEDSDSLISLVSSMAKRLYPVLHQMLSAKEPDDVNGERWLLFNQRLRDLIEERMNLRRGAVQRLLENKYSSSISRQLVLTLALSAGPGGVDRLRASLLDPIP